MRYGEIMPPLSIDKLRARLPEEMLDDPDLDRFIGLIDSTQRAEIVSHHEMWTSEEKQAYQNGDWVAFSRLRGYNDAEIEEFQRYLEMASAFRKKYGEDDADTIIYEHQRQVCLVGEDPRAILESGGRVKRHPAP